MLKKFGIPIILYFIVILTACDQGIPKMMKPVLTPEPTTVVQPMSEAEAQGMVYPEITFENVLELMPGEKYRMGPTESHEGTGAEGVIYSVSWGSVGGNPKELLEGFTEDDPKVYAWFSMGNAGKVPYAKTLDGKPVIAKDPVWDEIVIEIISFGGLSGPGGSKQTGGPRGNRFDFTLVEYDAILIENLTHPDRKFEYE